MTEFVYSDVVFCDLLSGCFQFRRRCVLVPESRLRRLGPRLLHRLWGWWHLREETKEVFIVVTMGMVSKESDDCCLTLAALILEPQTFSAVRTGIYRDTEMVKLIKTLMTTRCLK